MAPTRHSVLVLLGLAISIRAAPAGVKERQIGLLPPKQSISWEGGNPEPTEDPQTPALPPIFPPQPSDQISLGQPSGWISWETSGPAPTPAPEEPEYPPPSTPTDQISLGQPSGWISWETSGPAPTSAPEEPEYPAPTKPTDQISLGQPSGWISWETSGPSPTPTPEEPEYPPSKPSDQISLGQPSYSVTWDGNGPGASSTPQPEPTPKPEPSKSSLSPSPSGPKSTKSPEYPGYPPWKPWPSKSTKSKAKTTPKPSPTPKPTPPKETDQISLGSPRYSVSWDLEKREEVNDIAIKPTYSKTKPKPKPTSKKPKPSPSPKPTPTPTPDPTPSPTDPGDEITIGPPQASVSWDNGSPQASISWGKKRQFEYDPEATDEPVPEDEEPLPEDPEDEEPIEIPSFPIPTQPNSIGLQPPKVSFGWGKREAAPQTEVDTIGFQFPWHTIYWPKPSPPSYVSWGKRQDEPEPTAVPENPEFPEDPEFPGDPEETGPIEIPAFPVPTPANSIGLLPPKQSVGWGKRQDDPETDTIGLQFPTYSFFWPKPSPPTYISWGKRQDEEEPTEIPAQPAPTPSDEVVIAPPQASISWGKRDDYPAHTKPVKPTPAPAPSSKHVKPTPKPTPPAYTPVPPHTPIKPPPTPSYGICPDVTATLIPYCTPPKCPHGNVACDWNLPVPIMEKRVKEREVEKTTIVTIIKTLPPATSAKSTPVVSKCSTAKTTTASAACPTFTCVPWCDPAQVVR